MNKRIREIAKEHGFVHDFMTVGEYNDALQKFEKIAELIVRECAKVANENVGAFTPACGNCVLEHFGVETE